MTRSDLIKALAARFDHLEQREAEKAVRAILDTMLQTLANGERIEIRGFGSFSITERGPRMGRNPRSGVQVPVAAKCVPHFKPGKLLREELNQTPPAPQ